MYGVAVKVGEGGRRWEKVGEGWRRLEKVGEGWRRLVKVGEGGEGGNNLFFYQPYNSQQSTVLEHRNAACRKKRDMQACS